jgi:tetratricopeptide (TPR) repeat protein
VPGHGRAGRRREQRRPEGDRAQRTPAVRWPVPSYLLIGSLLFIGVAVLYWPATRFDFINVDDEPYVTDNRHVQAGLSGESVRWAFTTGETRLWHPLTWLSHMLDVQLHGMAPGGHHLTSVLLHAANAALVFVVLTKMTGAPRRSAIVAALFGLHPLRVESVAWVAERKDVLSGLFFLLTLWAYAEHARRPTRRGLGVVAILFAAGLMAKPMLVTLPFVLLLLDYWPLSRFAAGWRSLVLEKVPFIVMAVAATVVGVLVGRGSLSSVDELTIMSRVSNAVVAYASYLGKTLWPTGLAVFYPRPDAWPMEDVVGAALLLAAITALAVAARHRCPYLPVGWFWFVGTLLPVIGLLQVGEQAMADRFTYIPSIGLFIALVWGSAELVRRWRLPAAVAAGATIAVLGALAATSSAQLAYWRDSSTLLAHAVNVTSSNWFAENNLGYALSDQGKVEEAIAHYQAALRIKPGYVDALNNLGYELFKQNRVDEAIAHFRAALQTWPDYLPVLNNLSEALLRQGKIEEATPYIDAALKASPDSAVAIHNLGTALALQGRIDEAADRFRAALRLSPRYADAHYNLGAALAAQGKADEAMVQFTEALKTNPRYAKAHAALGNLLFRRGQWTEAVPHLTEALRLDPGLADAHFHLAMIRSRQGQTAEAAEHYAAAIRLQPSLASQVSPGSR